MRKKMLISVPKPVCTCGVLDQSSFILLGSTLSFILKLPQKIQRPSHMKLDGSSATQLNINQSFSALVTKILILLNSSKFYYVTKLCLYSDGIFCLMFFNVFFYFYFFFKVVLLPYKSIVHLCSRDAAGARQ